MNNESYEKHELRVGLSGLDAAALVVGCIIGTGVFLKAAVMSQQTGSALLVFVAFLVAGALSMTGALCYAELGSRFPKAGGEFVFLREGYGDLTAFLYGWSRFWIGSPGSIAAYAVGAATFCWGFLPQQLLINKTAMAVLFVGFFTAINCLAVKVGGRVQTFLTALKVVALAGVAFLILTMSVGPSHLNLSLGSAHWPGLSQFSAAIIAALWAFDGWNNLPMVSSEIRNPQRNVPLAIIGGTLAVFVIYLLVNIAYFHGLPFDQVVTSNSSSYPDAPPVATRAFSLIYGSVGATILSVVMAVSALGAMNGSVLSNARVPYAMAHEGLFFKALGRVHPNTHVPVISILVQGLVSAVLAMSGTFDQLTDAVVFSSWIFYAMAAASLFKLRRKKQESKTYQVPGYPVVPFVFVVVASGLLIMTVVTNPMSTLLGVGFLGLGAVLFKLRARR